MLGYFKEKIFCFTELSIKENVEEITKELEVFNFKKGKKRQIILPKEKRNTLATTYFTTSSLFESLAAVFIPDLFALFIFFALAICIPSFFATIPKPSLSALFTSSVFDISIFKSSTLFTFFAFSMLVS